MKYKVRIAIPFILISLILSIAFVQCSSSKKIENLDRADVKNMIDSSRFIFIAERMNPLRGRTRYLTSSYDVTVRKDTVASFLPFFGRAYQAPMDPSKGGIQFTSTRFSYDVQQKKDNEWDVMIVPKDYPDVQQLHFNIFENGTATLNVVSTNRDAISFYGHLERIGD